MPVSERSRKILWVKAGGRCSFCRLQLAGEPTGSNDPSVFGEEAHVVAKSPGGPRARAYDGDIDGYGNLILLCSKCHKQVDDQVSAYPEERLLQIKRDHEVWTAQLGQEPGPDPVRLIPDPAHPVPEVLKLMVTGTEFWHYFDGCTSFGPTWPAGLSDEHEDLIAGFLQGLEDWMDITSGHSSYAEKREAARAMAQYISELAKAGFLLGASKRHLLLTGGIDSAPTPWLKMDIEIQPASIALLAS